jgi:uncharacterized membrane protein YhhN
MYKILILVLFILFAAANLISLKAENSKWDEITKPFLMPLLLLFYLSCVSAPNGFIVAALIFGFLGDVFLLGSGFFFMAGLFAFLTGHVLYIIAFLTAVSFSHIPIWFYLLIIPFAAYALFVYRKLLPHLKEMKLHVALYLIVIISMSFASLLRLWTFNGSTAWLPFIGSLLFIVSDSLLSFNTFKSKVHGREVIIMLTYILAQMFIIAGFIL